MGTGIEGLYSVLHVILKDIIPEDHDYILVIREIFCEGEGLGDAACEFQTLVNTD